METTGGFITLHKKILDNPVFQNAGLFRLFVYLLFTANYRENKFWWNGAEIIVHRGQLITGRFKLAEVLQESPNTIKDWLKTLGKMKIITSKSTNKYTLITIVKYNDYQLTPADDTSKPTNKTPTKHQQNTTIELSNTVNKDNKDTLQPTVAGIQELFKLFYDTTNPNINFGNKTYRAAAQWLIEKYGLEKTMSAAKYAIEVQKEQYAPTITNPYQLKEKMSALAKFKLTQGQGNKVIWKRKTPTS